MQVLLVTVGTLQYLKRGKELDSYAGLAGYHILQYLKSSKELESVGNAAAVAEGLELGAGAQQEGNHFPLQRGA
jgi:hypothetical protein